MSTPFIKGFSTCSIWQSQRLWFFVVIVLPVEIVSSLLQMYVEIHWSCDQCRNDCGNHPQLPSPCAWREQNTLGVCLAFLFECVPQIPRKNSRILNEQNEQQLLRACQPTSSYFLIMFITFHPQPVDQHGLHFGIVHKKTRRCCGRIQATFGASEWQAWTAPGQWLREGLSEPIWSASVPSGHGETLWKQ